MRSDGPRREAKLISNRSNAPVEAEALGAGT